MLNEAYLGLGSNLGNSAENLRAALDMMRQFARGIRTSSLYRTAPQGFRNQPAFYNTACCLWTPLDPYELMAQLLAVEAAIGRRRTFRNAPRVLDIDILFYNRLVVDTPPLTLPHPRIGERLFVLKPLADIAPQLTHPVSGESTRDMLARLQAQSDAIEAVAWPAWILGDAYHQVPG